MGEINVNLAALDGFIAQFNALARECRSMKVTPPTINGSGKTAAEFQNMVKQYGDLNESVANLAAATAGFFMDVKNNYEKYDNAAVEQWAAMQGIWEY